jgi:hypothetical protein
MLPAGGDLLIWAVTSDGFAQDFDTLDFGANGLGCGLGEM